MAFPLAAVLGRSGCAVALICSAYRVNSAWAIVVGQVDSFETGNSQGWIEGTNGIAISAGGPAGNSGHYLPVTSGAGAVPRLLAFNNAQWIGDFATAGVTAVDMDLKNFGAGALPIRIAIREGSGGSTTPGYSTSVAFNLPADGVWHHATFSLSAGSLTAINSPQPLAMNLTNVADFRLLSSVAPATIGDAITAQIGVDNVEQCPSLQGLCWRRSGLQWQCGNVGETGNSKTESHCTGTRSERGRDVWKFAALIQCD